MKCWDEYINYIKDNPEGYWFKNKLYGYGWTPAKPAGWFTVLIYLAFILGFTWYSESSGFVSSSTSEFITVIFGATAVLLAICWKTGETLKWKWGRKSENK